MKKWFFLIFANIAIFCTLIVCMELFGQMAYYLIKGRFLFEKSYKTDYYHRQVFELHPYLAGRLRKNITVENNGKRIKTTNNNTRWTGAPEDNSKLVRIAVLGGSTAFGTGVTDSDSWPALLQSKLGSQFCVINYGVPGYSTAEAIIQMALIVSEAKPNIVILYQGWNDIRNYHEKELGVDYYGHGMRQYKNLSIPTFNEKTVFDKFVDVSAIFRFVCKIRLKLSPPSEIKSSQPLKTHDPFVDRIYVRNLKTLKLLSENIGSYALFVPQILNNSNYIGKEDSYSWSRNISNSSMPELMHRFNSLMQSICSDNDSKCSFLNSVLTESWGLADFVDNGHFSKRGGEKFAEIISELILIKAKEGNFYKHAQQDAAPDRFSAALQSGR